MTNKKMLNLFLHVPSSIQMHQHPWSYHLGAPFSLFAMQQSAYIFSQEAFPPRLSIVNLEVSYISNAESCFNIS